MPITPIFPASNRGAAYGAAVVTILVFLLQDLLKFLESGQPYPTTADGWIHLLLPALVAGALAAITPYVQHAAPDPAPAPVPAPAVINTPPPPRVPDVGPISVEIRTGGGNLPAPVALPPTPEAPPATPGANPQS